MNFKFFLIYTLLIINNFIYSFILSDLTEDHSFVITIDKKGSKKEKKEIKDDLTGDVLLGNVWYSKFNVYNTQEAEMGASGTRDFFSERLLFNFRFRSKNAHAFSLRISEVGYAPGIFTGNMEMFNFGIFAGFEHFIKIFNAYEGLFWWIDIGGCNKGPAFYTGLGIGSRVKNGFEMGLFYLHNISVLFRLDFYFLVFNILTLKGRLGIDVMYNYSSIEAFTFLNGFYIGAFIKKIFRIELGGGFTFNEFGFFSGFGGVNISLQFM